MENFKIIRLMGGLGNQMFQYVFGCALKRKHGCNILYDKSYFDEMTAEKNGLPSRVYELDIFKNINPSFAPKELVEKYYEKNIFGKYKYFFREKYAFEYNDDMFDDPKKVLYEGYFQNEYYFKSIHAFIKECFKLPPIKPNDTYNKELFNKITNTKNSVFIHVRRGEYINLKMGLPINYYRNAVKYINQKLENPKYFVFCAEDPDYIKNNFDIGCDFEFVGEKNTTRETFYENMRLMGACKHSILANSSYSWWAAYLSNFEEKIVIGPSPWLKRDDRIICDGWVKMKY